MTDWGAEKLQTQIDELTLVERPRIAAEVAAARGSGNEADRSALRNAQHELAQCDRELEYLGELMRTAEIVPARSGVADRVAFGTTVKVRDRYLQREETYQIVGVYESQPDQGLISWISPIAKALKGKGVGETVEIALPDGVRLLKIVTVTHSTQP